MNLHLTKNLVIEWQLNNEILLNLTFMVRFPFQKGSRSESKFFDWSHFLIDITTKWIHACLHIGRLVFDDGCDAQSGNFSMMAHGVIIIIKHGHNKIQGNGRRYQQQQETWMSRQLKVTGRFCFHKSDISPLVITKAVADVDPPHTGP